MSGRPTINVDEAVLVLCNRAFRLCEQEAGATVEIAHLVVCLSAAPLADHDFHRAGIDRRRLSEAAQAWLRTAGRARDGQTPRTSIEVKTLLSRAEAFATTEGRKFASPHDLIRALAHRCDDLATARFVGEAMARGEAAAVQSARTSPDGQHDRGAAEWERGPRPRQLQFRFEQRYRPLSAPQGRHGATGQETAPRLPSPAEDRDRLSAGGLREDGPTALAPAGDAGRSVSLGLAERLERQETLVAGLVGLMSRVIDTRPDATNARAASVRRRPRKDEGDDRSGAGSGAASAGEQVRQGHAERAHRSGQSRLRWMRRRTLVLGPGGGLSMAKQGDRDEGRGGRNGLLRVVSDSVGRRARAVREPGLDLEAPNASHGEFDSDDDGDGPGDRMKRFYLSPDDDIVRAPSIGPKTAARLTPAGLVLVGDLLACDPERVAARVANRYITAGRIADWKAQARLVCTIPWLRGTHAQLLVGAGYDTLAKLSRADASSVCAAILRFSATREGQSILRSGPPPEIDRIACWIENTALAEPARAA